MEDEGKKGGKTSDREHGDRNSAAWRGHLLAMRCEQFETRRRAPNSRVFVFWDAYRPFRRGCNCCCSGIRVFPGASTSAVHEDLDSLAWHSASAKSDF